MSKGYQEPSGQIDFKNFYSVERELQKDKTRNKHHISDDADDLDIDIEDGVDNRYCNKGNKIKHSKSKNEEVDQLVRNFQNEHKSHKYSLHELERYMDSRVRGEVSVSEHHTLEETGYGDGKNMDMDIDRIIDSPTDESYGENNTHHGGQITHNNKNDIHSDLESYYIVDTNCLLSNLGVIEDLRQMGNSLIGLSASSRPDLKFQIIVPSIVLKEVDSLKKYSNKETKTTDGKNVSLQKLSKIANDWLYTQLSTSDPVIKVQKKNQTLRNKNSNDLDFYTDTNDDAIVDCALYFQNEINGTKEQNTPSVILISNDKNLCNKCLSEDIQTINFSINQNNKENKISAKDIVTISGNLFVSNQLQSLVANLDKDILHILNETTEMVNLSGNNHNANYTDLTEFVTYIKTHWDYNNGDARMLFQQDTDLYDFALWHTNLLQLYTIVHTTPSINEIITWCKIWSKILMALHQCFLLHTQKLNETFQKWESFIQQTNDRIINSSVSKLASFL